MQPEAQSKLKTSSNAENVKNGIDIREQEVHRHDARSKEWQTLENVRGRSVAANSKLVMSWLDGLRPAYLDRS